MVVRNPNSLAPSPRQSVFPPTLPTPRVALSSAGCSAFFFARSSALRALLVCSCLVFGVSVLLSPSLFLKAATRENIHAHTFLPLCILSLLQVPPEMLSIFPLV
eukprot:RCo039604